MIFLLCVTLCLSRYLLGLGQLHSAEPVLSLTCKRGEGQQSVLSSGACCLVGRGWPVGSPYLSLCFLMLPCWRVELPERPRFSPSTLVTLETTLGQLSAVKDAGYRLVWYRPKARGY